MSFCVGSGPMPQAETAAAPPPVTPKILRNRLRFIPSVMSSPPPSLEMARRAVARHLALDVAPDAPAHFQRRYLIDARLLGDLAMAIGARFGARAERLDVTHMREVYEVGDCVDADPLGRRLVAPRVADLGDLGAVSVGGAADHLMAADARLHGRNPRLAGDGGRVVAVHAGDTVLSGVDVVAEENRLARSPEISGVADDGGFEWRRRGAALRHNGAHEPE